MTGAALRALAPALVFLSYFLGGFVAFGVRSGLRGRFHDREIEARGESILVSFYCRNYFVWVTRPLWWLLVKLGLTANAVTVIAAALGAASGAAAAVGRLALAGWLFLFSGILDAMDGRLARARGEVGASGTAFDSVLDRYTDSILLIGLAWYFRSSWVLLPTLAAMLGTSLVPYVRAKAETLGVPMTGGLMQRAERILYLGGALALSPVLEALLAPHPPHPFSRLAAAGVSFLALTTNLTALKRFARLMEATGGPAARGGGRPSPAAAARATAERLRRAAASEPR